MRIPITLAFICTLAASVNAQNDPSTIVGSTGTVTFDYGTDPVVYTTVRAADGRIWLQQNLGAQQVATSSADAAAYGHYFQWGRWADGHQVPGSPTTPTSGLVPNNNPSGIPAGNPNFIMGIAPEWWSGGTGNDTWTSAPPSTTNGTDPCTAIGEGWHTPSTNEFADLVTAEGITDNVTAFNSNLKLVVAGFRHSMNGGIILAGTSGAYWTSDANAQRAELLGFWTSTVTIPDIAERGHGFSMRCVTDCTGVFPPAGLNGDDTVCLGSTQTYYIEDVNNAETYLWTVPTDWTIIGPANTTALTVIVGNTSGAINVEAGNGCNNASLSTLITVAPLPVPVINASANTLTTGTFTSYQWLVNDTIVTGATMNPYTATESGPYSVIVTDANGCSDTSVVFAHTLGVNNVSGAAQIKVYPNPAVNVLHIDAPMNVNITIYSIDGRMAMNQMNATQVDISTLPSGTYHVKMTDKDGVTVKMEKLTVLRQ